MGGKSIRVLAADPHPIVGAGLKELFAASTLEVIACAASGEQLCALYDLHKPDVVLMELDLPGMGGVEALRRIRRHDKTAKVLVLSAHESTALLAQALCAGAGGYLTKGSDPQRLIAAVYDVARGERVFDPELLARVRPSDRTAACDQLRRLTPREALVFQLEAEGLTIADIAAALAISPKTASAHLRSTRHKLAIDTPVDLVRLAIAAGLIDC